MSKSGIAKKGDIIVSSIVASTIPVEKFSLYEDLTVGENLQFFGGVYGLKDAEIARRKKELFRLLSLGEVERQKTAQLPLDWKQRVPLASAVIHQPKIVFLDEPTSGVDPISLASFRFKKQID